MQEKPAFSISKLEKLSKKKIYQAHHLIFANIDTKLEDVFENLIKIVKLRAMHGEYFDILRPAITNLVSLQPTASYKNNKHRGLEKFLKVKAKLINKNLYHRK